MRAASSLRQMERENEMIVISHRLFLHAEDIGMRACVNQRQCENIILNDFKPTIHFYAIINPALQTKNDFQSSIYERE